jgi:putative efflux protein, MATE family
MMVNDHQLCHDSICSLFCRFTLPAVAGIVVAGIQTIVDGFFIGNGVGSQGLAAITLAFPVLMFIVAIGIMFGIGSSSLVALELGCGNRKRARRIVANVFSILILLGAAISATGLLFLHHLIALLGASSSSGAMVEDYLGIILAGAVFVLFSLAMEPLVRNDGRPVFAMKIMVVSVLINVLLDYVFVIRMGLGMGGAAFATMIAFAMISVLNASHFFSSRAKLRVGIRDFAIDYILLGQIIRSGMPSFVMQFSISLLLLVHNFMLLRYGSEVEVSAFGIIDYSFSMFYMLFEGIAMGMQPIIGFNYGAGLYGRVSRTLKLAMLASFVVGVAGFMLFTIFPGVVAGIFNPDDAHLLGVTVNAMRIFMVSLLVQGVIVVNATYYQSVNKIRSSMLIHLGRVFVFVLPLLFMLPALFGLTGIWLATPVADVMMFVVVMFMVSGEIKRLEEKKLECLMSREKCKNITPQY